VFLLEASHVQNVPDSPSFDNPKNPPARIEFLDRSNPTDSARPLREAPRRAANLKSSENQSNLPTNGYRPGILSARYSNWEDTAIGPIEFAGVTIVLVLLILAGQRFFANKRLANGKRDLSSPE
jgi:hypothetical protein